MIQIVKKKAKKNLPMGGFKKWQRHTLPGITLVPSAQIGLTSLFGMGRGGPYCNSHRNVKYVSISNTIINSTQQTVRIKSLQVISTTRLCHH